MHALRSPVFVFLALACSAAACSSSRGGAAGASGDAGPDATHDAAPVDGASPDAAPGDAAHSDAGPSDAAEASTIPDATGDAPSAVSLVPFSADLTVFAVTSDGEIIYGQNQTLMAVSSTGGVPVTIAGWADLLFDFDVVGPTVVVTTSAGDGGGSPFAILTWSRTAGLKTVTPAATDWALDTDGTKLAYVTAGATPALVVSNADGTSPKTLATGTGLGVNPYFASDGTLMMTTILSDGMNGQVDGAVLYAPDGTPTNLGEGAWHLSPDGQWLIDFASTTDLAMRKTVGGTLTTIDTQATLAAWFDPGSTEAVYFAGKSLKRVVLATQTVSTVGTPPCDEFFAFSPDGRYVVCYDGTPTPTIIVDLTTGVYKQGPASGLDLSDVAFTSDSAYGVFNGSTEGLLALPLAGTTTTPTLSVPSGDAQSFAILSPTSLLAMGDSLTVNDVTGKTAAKTLATNVTSAAASPDGKLAGYVTTAAPAGLYAVPTP